MQEAPQAYKNAGIANMAGGAFNLLTSAGMGLSLILVCVGIWWLVPAAAAAFQVFVGYKMYNGEADPNAKNACFAGIAAGLLSGNIFSAAVAVFALLQVNDDEVAGWIETNAM